LPRADDVGLIYSRGIIGLNYSRWSGCLLGNCFFGRGLLRRSFTVGRCVRLLDTSLLRRCLLDRPLFLGLLIALETIFVGASTNTVRLCVFDGRRGALCIDTHLAGEIEQLLVRHAELFGELGNTNLL